jgi:hypothetical protein
MSAMERRVTFHRVYAHGRRGSRFIAETDWRTVLERWQQSQHAARDARVGEVYCLPDLTQVLPALALHSEAEQAFQSVLDMQTASVTDLEEQVQAGSLVANSTAVVFLPKKGLIAVAKGDRSSPGKSAIVDFLEAAIPFDTDEHWRITDVLDRAQIAKFREQDGGVRRVEAHFDTVQDLTTCVDEAGALVEPFDLLTNQIGSELSIDITITLADGGRQRGSSRRKFKNAVVGSLGRLATSKRARVFPVSAIGSDEEAINLVASKYSVMVAVSDDVQESRSFSRLMAATANEGARRENTLDEMVD